MPLPRCGILTPGKETSDAIIELVHSPKVDPNFLNMSARNLDELKLKASSSPGSSVKARKQALERYTQEAQEAAKGGDSWARKLVTFLQEKQAANEALWSIYFGDVEPKTTEAFLDASNKVWSEELPAALDKAEELIKGPYLLGDQVVSWPGRGR